MKRSNVLSFLCGASVVCLIAGTTRVTSQIGIFSTAVMVGEAAKGASLMLSPTSTSWNRDGVVVYALTLTECNDLVLMDGKGNTLQSWAGE